MITGSLKISNDTPFVIYGGGEVGNICAQALRQRGYILEYALDKEKSGDHVIKGLHTYKLGEQPKPKNREIVIICLADGLIHKMVADRLHEIGYEFIIFLPMRHCIPDREKMVLTRAYNQILTVSADMIGISVYSYTKYASLSLDLNSAVIRENECDVTVWCGIEILFTESLELWKGNKEKIYFADNTKDKNIAAKEPCKLLFDYYSLASDTCERYLGSNKKKLSNGERQIVLEQREELYRLFKKEYNKGLDFFVEGAPPVIWNPKKYFNLIGGHHRTAFLLHKEHSIFPVKMQKNDFSVWCNYNSYKKLLDYIAKYHIETLYAPLPHPGFLNFPSICENNGRTKLEQVLSFFSDTDISQLTVLDNIADEGYFARIMARIGVKKTVFRTLDDRQLELAELCNQLLYRDDVIIEKGTNSKNILYDIVFGEEKDRYDLEKIYTKYLFIETTEEVQNENYCCLFKEYNAGQVRVLGVYIK